MQYLKTRYQTSGDTTVKHNVGACRPCVFQKPPALAVGSVTTIVFGEMLWAGDYGSILPCC